MPKKLQKKSQAVKKQPIKKEPLKKAPLKTITLNKEHFKKNPKKLTFSILLFVVFILLGLFFFIDSGAFRKTEDSFFPLFPNFSDAQVAKIEITRGAERGAETVILLKNGQQWSVRAETVPMGSITEKNEASIAESESGEKPYPADGALVSSALSTLKELKPDSIASRNQEKYRALQVDEVSALKVVAFDPNGKKLVSLFVGKKGPTFTSQYVRKFQENVVYLVNKNLSAVFEKDEWRDKTIVSMAKENLVKIVVKSREGKIAFEKIADLADAIGSNVDKGASSADGTASTGENGSSSIADSASREGTSTASENVSSWNITKPEIKPADQTQIDNILGDLSHLQALSFASNDIFDNVDLENDPSSTKVWMQETSGNAVTLYFYQKDDGVYAKRSDLEQVFTVSQAVVNDLKKLNL